MCGNASTWNMVHQHFMLVESHTVAVCIIVTVIERNLGSGPATGTIRQGRRPKMTVMHDGCGVLRLVRHIGPKFKISRPFEPCYGLLSVVSFW